jgi:hypothetical protein
MGKYAMLMYITREFREDTGLDLDAQVAVMCLDKTRAAGYHPAGEPRLDWHQMDETDVMIYYGALGLAYDPDDQSAPVRPGDWQVRAIVRVTEDADLSSPVPS